MNDIYVAGVGMTPFGRLLERSVYDWSARPSPGFERCWRRAADVGSAFYATLTNGQFRGRPPFRGRSPCAVSASKAFRYLPSKTPAPPALRHSTAVQALRAGTCDVALAVGAEKMNIADKAKMFAAFDGGWDVSTVEENKKTLLALGEGVEPPPGTMSERPYSVFMDVYAAIARNHMKRYGTTQHQIAAVAAKNHQHSVHNPLAQFQQPMTIEQVLASPPIAYPLTTAMCSPISDGAAAALLCTAAGLERLRGASGRAVRVLASVIHTGTTRSLDEPHKIVAHRRRRPTSRPASPRRTLTLPKCTMPPPSARSSTPNR